MILGIMGAMPDEVDQLCARLENVTVEPYGGVEYHKGTLAGKQVVVCCAGMGKANAAATTQVLITKFCAEKMIPSSNVPYDWANGAFQMAEAYYQLGQTEKANKIIDELANKSLEYMVWYLSLTDYQLSIASENFMYNAGLLDAEVRLMEKYKSEELAKHYSEQLDQLYNEYVTRMKGK